MYVFMAINDMPICLIISFFKPSDIYGIIEAILNIPLAGHKNDQAYHVSSMESCQYCSDLFTIS